MAKGTKLTGWIRNLRGLSEAMAIHRFIEREEVIDQRIADLEASLKEMCEAKRANAREAEREALWVWTAGEVWAAKEATAPAEAA